jgi:hypothetical protein
VGTGLQDTRRDNQQTQHYTCHVYDTIRIAHIRAKRCACPGLPCESLMMLRACYAFQHASKQTTLQVQTKFDKSHSTARSVSLYTNASSVRQVCACSAATFWCFLPIKSNVCCTMLTNRQLMQRWHQLTHPANARQGPAHCCVLFRPKSIQATANRELCCTCSCCNQYYQLLLDLPDHVQCLLCNG